MNEFIPTNGTPAPPQGGNAKPLPDGTKVLATILPTNKDGSSIVRRPFANQGPNAGITALGVRFRIEQGQQGAGRNVFADVPLARSFASGNPAYDFWGFFRALGMDPDVPNATAPNGQEGWAVPADAEILGKQIELVLTIEDDGKGGQRNGVRFFNEANGIPDNSNLQPRGAASGAPAAGAWTPGGAPAAAQTPPAQQGFQPPAGGQQQAATPGWVPDAQQPAQPQQQAAPQGFHPPQADPALQAAAASAGGF